MSVFGCFNMNGFDMGGQKGRKSRVSTVVSALYEEITSGKYLVGSKLPTEAALSEQFGVSRSTIREAVRELSSKGMLESQQGSGIYCVSTTPRPSSFSSQMSAEDLEGIYEVRSIIEIGMVRLAATKRTNADIANIKRFLDARQTCMDAIDFDGYAEADIEFHTALSAATHNDIVIELFGDFSALLGSVLKEDESRNGFDENVQHLHAMVYESVATENPDAAEAFMRKIIENDLKWIKR